MQARLHQLLRWVAIACLASGCGGDEPPSWTVVREQMPRAAMSVWGTSANDVWIVGADAPGDGEGPLVMRWDGATWTTHSTSMTGHLWWVFGVASGAVYMGGQGGQILRYQDGTFTRMTTPGAETVFGIWGPSEDNLWAVGANDGGQSGGFVWRLQGDAWVSAPGLPDVSQQAVWKVHGKAADDVWFVGTSGLALHWNGIGFEETRLGSTPLFTVNCSGAYCTAVGGFATAVIFEHDGSMWRETISPSDSPLSGTCVDTDHAFAVGDFGAVVERADGAWRLDDPVPTNETLHAVWIDPDDGVWTVGGRVRVSPLERGVIAYRGHSPPR